MNDGTNVVSGGGYTLAGHPHEEKVYVPLDACRFTLFDQYEDGGPTVETKRLGKVFQIDETFTDKAVVDICTKYSNKFLYKQLEPSFVSSGILHDYCFFKTGWLRRRRHQLNRPEPRQRQAPSWPHLPPQEISKVPPTTSATERAQTLSNRNSLLL